MACIKLPEFPPLPDINPLTLELPELPTLDLSADFCCRLELLIPPPFIPLGALVVAIPGASEVIALINEALDQIDEYIDAIPLDCPLD